MLIASSRRRQNDISGIHIEGVVQDDLDARNLAIVEHFRKAFLSDIFATSRLDRIPFKTLSVEVVADLVLEVSMEEMKAVVFSLSGDKAPGPDGDPLSPFLFTIYAECFSLMITNVVNNGRLTGFSVGHNGPVISHVDDTLIFMEAKKDYIEYLGNFLRCCEVVLGLKVNISKTSLVGVNCNGGLVEDLAQVLGCKVEQFPITYLGLPISDSRLPISVWD
ncbi:hypothetical protein AMTRI_Chr01g134930 [Amborella trichopoda]